MIGSFDRLGFWRHQRRFRAADLEVDLGGRRCLVTGGNAGLGLATARGLAAKGAWVTLLCRDAGRAEAARDTLKRETGSPRVDFAVVDVSELSSVRRFLADAAPEQVHALIHNAGLLPAHRQLTADGHELTFATHVVGPHLLTHGLAAALRADGDARVVFVSSGGMYTQRLSFEDLDWSRRRYDGVVAYAQTKRMQVVLAERWADAFRDDPVSVYSMHPGWADTGGVRTSLPRFYRLTRPVLRTADQGADTVVWLAVCAPAPPSGGFYFDRRQTSPHVLPWTRESPEEQQRLWTMCQRAVLTAPAPGARRTPR